MSEGRVVISSDTSLGPDEVAHRGFSSSFRGYDQNEVRAFLRKVAEELRASREREREMRKSVEDARHSAAHPAPLDEAALTAVLGQEAGRILQTAKEAAADIRAKAEENAGRLLRESEEKSARLLKESEERAVLLRRGAETVMAERSDEAEKAAAAIRRAAEAEAESIRAQALARVGEEIEAAKVRGKEMVGEAQALRERVLADLVRRRSMARVQIEQLRAGRERLIEAYRVVRRTLDEATEELSVVETEAKVAADSAARRAASAPEGSVDELEADLSTARRADLPLVEPSSTWMARPQAVPDIEEPPAAPPAPPPPVAAPAPPPAPAVEPELSVGPEPEAAIEPEPEPSEPPDALEPVVRVLQAFDVDAVAAELANERPAADAPVEAAPVEDGPALEEEHEAGPETAATSVEDLFARIKADRADAVARARAVLDEIPDLEADPELASPNGSMVVSDVDESLLQRRDEMLDPIEEQLARKLKRAMQDEQNELLDAMRVARRPLRELVPDDDTHGRRYADVATPALLDALREGAAFANPAAPCPDGLDEEVVPLVAALADDLATPLRRRVADALTEATDEGDTQVAVDRLGAAFRQWKIERVGPIARHHVTAAFTRGAFLGSADERLRWVVDDDGASCPDCEDNALAGPTPRGEAFPTRPAPPARTRRLSVLARAWLRPPASSPGTADH